MTDRPESQATLEAIGAMLMALPAVQELCRFRETLPDDLPQEELEEALGGKAAELGLTPVGLAAHYVPEEVLQSDALPVVLSAAKWFYEQVGPFTVAELLEMTAKQLAWTQWLTGYTGQIAAGSQSPLGLAEFIGGVRVIRPTWGEMTQTIVAGLAGPLTPIDEFLAEFKEAWLREFGRLPQMRREVRTKAAWCFAQFEGGRTNREIAVDLLGDPESYATPEEYKQERRLMTDRVRQYRHRWSRLVTEVDRLASRDST